MSYSISTLLTRNLHDVFGENDPARRRAASSNNADLLAQPRVRSFIRWAGMPAHEVGKRLELARRFDRPQTRYPLCHFRQGARDGEHQVGLRNRQDCRNKERNSERDMTL